MEPEDPDEYLRGDPSPAPRPRRAFRPPHLADAAITAAVNRVCDAVGGRTDPFVVAAARRVLCNVERRR